MSWYTLVFLTLAFAAITFAAIMSHIPRIPQQRGLLAVILISALNALWSLLVTQVADPAKGIEVSRTIFDILVVMLALAILAGLLDFVYYILARRRRLDGAGWSLFVAIALIACGVYGLLAHYNVIG
ncbi:MAG: hypothetical protein U0232_29200 [Thermomicrobiales bacterium]